jgi:hypothetical protein
VKKKKNRISITAYLVIFVPSPIKFCSQQGAPQGFHSTACICMYQDREAMLHLEGDCPLAVRERKVGTGEDR